MNEQRIFTHAVQDFSERLFTACSAKETGENLVLSPLSVMYALSLVANGASEETLRELERGNGGISVEKMNGYLKALAERLARSEGSTVDTANSVWANAALFRLDEGFVGIAREFYDALAKTVDFGDSATLGKINRWVCEKTDGMISDALDGLDPTTTMVLLNTVLFNGKWDEPYAEEDVRNGVFTNADGTIADVRFMQSKENSYFEVDGGRGFMKAYRDGYSFFGILPDTGVTVEELVKNLRIADVLAASDAGYDEVHVSLPKFEYENKIVLNDLLREMGIERIFASDAELGRLGEAVFGNPYVSEILQKAKIITNENGTKAAAVTEMMIRMACLVPDEPKVLVFDRPFVYMILENKGRIPLFMGIVHRLG